MMPRAEVAQVIMGFFDQPLRARCGHAGYADAGFAGEQHDLAVCFLCALPKTSTAMAAVT